MLTLPFWSDKVIGYHYAALASVDFEMEEPLKWHQNKEQELKLFSHAQNANRETTRQQRIRKLIRTVWKPASTADSAESTHRIRRQSNGSIL